MSSAASGGDSQVVLLRFGVVADEAAAATELAKITKVGKKAQDELNKGQKIGPIKTDEAEKSLLQYWTRVARETDRALADRERKQLAWGAKLAAQIDREAADAIKAKKKEADAIQRQTEKLSQDLERQWQKDARAREKAEAQATKAVQAELEKQKGLYAANMRAAKQSIGDVADGFGAVARGFVLLGIAREDDLKKSVQQLAQFEGTINALKGVYGAAKSAADGIKAYTAAKTAAAAAQGLSTVANAATGGTSAAAAGIATGGAGSGGVTAAAGLLTGAGATLGAAASALLGAAFALTMAASKSARGAVAGQIEKTGWVDPDTIVGAGLGWIDDSSRRVRNFAGVDDINGIGGGNKGSTRGDYLASQKKFSGFESRYAVRRNAEDEAADDREAFNKSQQASFDLSRRGRAFGVDASSSRDRNSTALSVNASEREEVSKRVLDAERQIRDTQHASARDQVAAQQNLVQWQERQIQLEQDRLSINKQISQEQLDAAKTTRDSLVAQYNAAQQLADKIRDQTKSAEERFGQLDPVQQKRVIEAKKKADAGGELTREESAALRGFTDQADDQARAQDIARGRKFGGGQFADLFLKPNQQNEQSARQMAIDLQTNINTQNEIIVKLEADGATLAAQVTAIVKDITRQQADAIRAEMQKAISTDRHEQFQKEASGQAARAN